MEILLDYTETRNLHKILRDFERDESLRIKKVYAAIAFNQESSLIDICIKKSIPMDYWGLFNSGLSTDIKLIKKAIKDPNIHFYPFIKNYHPKLIYFEGFGIYIGSANMTLKALKYNVEAGVFIEENDLKKEDKTKLLTFFKFLRENSILMNNDDLEKLNDFHKKKTVINHEINKLQKEIDEDFENQFSYLDKLIPGPQQFDKKKANKKVEFYQEWRTVQKELKYISSKLEICKMPEWVSKDAPISIITDQFLHAYYYSYIARNEVFEDGKYNSKEKIHYFFEKNKNNKDIALTQALHWWEHYSNPLDKEDEYTNIWSIDNKKILSNFKNENYRISKNELSKVFLQNHAARNHARQIKNSYFNLAEGTILTNDDRVLLYADKLLQLHTKKGLDINDLLRYLLFNEEKTIEEKIYDMLNGERYHIEHFGKSIIGELACWGRPDTCFLRNNRVNKALRCLGYDVELY